MRAPKVPNPEAFDGSPDKIRGFLTQLELKLQGNPEYQDEKEQKRLFFSLLKGRALTWAFPYIRENNGKLPLAENLSMGELTQKLYDTFGDPDPRAEAEAKLMKLHQGGWTFNKYLTETLVLHTELDLNDDSKIMHFHRGLDPEIARLLLSNLEQLKEFDKFAMFCTQLDNNIQAFKQNQKGETPFT